ncbi:MAG: glycosyltransferase family 2 protein [Candidatus Levybacteria bacterium]|nr:glycosyltransferase family 2 protein [Candidatus Levybacteria bacterium]
MKLSIIIPVFNEEKTISEVLNKVNDVNIPGVDKEIIVVDDGSTDATASAIQTSKLKIQNLEYIKHQKNQGKGAAVRTGIKNATGDYIVIQDADLEYDPKDISRLIKVVGNGKLKAVYGTRLRRLPNFNRDERTLGFLLHYLGNKFLSFLTSILYGQWITDMETGYKLFPKAIVEDMKLNSKRFDFEPEITAKILKKRIRIIEVPIATNPRGYNEGKKLNTIKDGTIALYTLLKYRFCD